MTLLVWCRKSYPLQWQTKEGLMPAYLSLYIIKRSKLFHIVFVGNVLPGSESSVDIFVALIFITCRYVRV